MENTAIIKTKDLTKFYQIGSQKITALKDINLEIFEGEFLGIYGPSGSGKTTLMQLLGLLEKPSEGELNILGQSINDLSQKKRIALRQTKIGLIFQSAALLSRFTALENVEMPLIARDPPLEEEERIQIAKKTLERLGLAEKHDSFPDQLSGGEQQRAGIARSLVNNPKVLLADEPTGDLDSLTGEQIVKILRELPLSGKRTVVMVTHDDSYHDQFDRVLRLSDGQLVSK